MPPFPFLDSDAFHKFSEDAVVIFRKPMNEGIHPCDIRLVDGDWRLTGNSGYVMVVTGLGLHDGRCPPRGVQPGEEHHHPEHVLPHRHRRALAPRRRPPADLGLPSVALNAAEVAISPRLPAKEIRYLRGGCKWVRTGGRRWARPFFSRWPSRPSVFAVSGQVVYTEGDVAWRNGASTHDAAIGDPLGPGDVIVTGPKSLAVIDLANGTTLKLKEKTTLAIDSIGDVDRGHAHRRGRLHDHRPEAHRAGSRCRPRPPSRACAARSSSSRTGRTIDAKPDVWLCVNSGAVEVAIPETGQTVVVKQGLGINIVGGEKITSPKRYPWTRKLNWNIDPAFGDGR